LAIFDIEMQTQLPRLELPEVHRAHEREVSSLSEMLAHAYVADPVSRWLIPGDEQWTRFAHKYFSFLIRNAANDGVLFANEDSTAAALWKRPNPAQPGRIGKALYGLRMLSLLRARSARGMRLGRLLEEAHPTEPHWFLQFVGVEAHHRERGLASSVLRPVLERCDEERQAAYVETSNPANAPIFRHYGFEVYKTIDLAPGPIIRCMRRQPRPSGSLRPL
jgi:ribosomal protein S18 acetylase RimI-like enzyme